MKAPMSTTNFTTCLGVILWLNFSAYTQDHHKNLIIIKIFRSTGHRMTLVDLGVELGLLVSLAFFYYRWYWIIEILWWYIATFFSMQVPANHSLALSGGWPRMLEMVAVYKSWAILAYNHLESKQSPMVLYMPRGFIFIDMVSCFTK